MKHKVHLLGLFCLLIGLSSAAAQPLEQDLINSVVLLRGEAKFPCATGFLLENGDIITNAHVSRSICPLGACRNLRAYQAPKVGAEADKELSSSVEIAFELPSLDAALLKQSGGDIKKGVFKTGPLEPMPGDHAAALGFPRCGALAYSQGKVRSSGPIHIYTSIVGSHGSSGSPIFSPNRELVGIVDQSSSLTGALASLGWGAEFELRGIHASSIFSILGSDSKGSFLNEAILLKRQALERLRALDGSERVKEDMLFSNMIDGFKRRVLNSSLPPEIRLYLLHLGEYPGEIARVPRLRVSAEFEPLLDEIEQLTLAFNIETKGANAGIFSPLKAADFAERLNASTRSPGQIAALQTIMDDAVGEQGMEFRFTVRAAAWITIISFLLMIIAFSGGWMFARMRGGILRRGLLLVPCVLTWPISLFVFWFKPRKTGA